MRAGRPRPSPRLLAGWWGRGLLMGAADLVPGVSGGTVALVTRIYPRLLAVLNAGTQAATLLLRGQFRRAGGALRTVDWRFVGFLAAGVAMSVAALAGVIETLLVEQPVRTAAVFFGLMAGAVGAAARLFRRPAPFHLLFVVATAAVAFWGFGFQSAAVSAPAWWAFFLAGALGVCAFILPGVSGSFVLLSIGMYQPVIRALTGPDFSALVVFALGLVIGLGCFSRLLNFLLTRFHDRLLAVMIGLMVGSFRILWPWPHGLGDENGVGATVLAAPGPDVTVPLVLALLSAGVVTALVRWADGDGTPVS